MNRLIVVATCLSLSTLVCAETLVGLDISRELLEGAYAQLVVTVMPADDFERDTATWHPGVEPEWLHIEFGFANQGSDSFLPSRALYTALRPTFFQKIPDPAGFVRVKFRYWYSIETPRDLVGANICARVVVDQPPYEPNRVIRNQSEPRLESKTACFTIARSDSAQDTANAIGSHVWPIYDRGDYNRAIELVDSLLDTGWRQELAIGLGLTASRKVSNLQAQLKFLDALFEVCGCIAPREASDMPPFELIGGGTPGDTAAYNWSRDRILKEIEKQSKSTNND